MVGVAASVLVGVFALLRNAAVAEYLPGWLAPLAANVPAGTSVDRVVPEGTRIKVEVLNASDVRGAARTVAFLLRDAGFDVVYFGNTRERHDSTVVRDRSGHPEWATLAKRVMEPAAVESAPDSTRLLDLTVLIGALWRPPMEAFRP